MQTRISRSLFSEVYRLSLIVQRTTARHLPMLAYTDARLGLHNRSFEMICYVNNVVIMQSRS